MACDLLGSFTNVLKVTKDMCVQLWSVTVIVRPKRVLTREEVGLETFCTAAALKWEGVNGEVRMHCSGSSTHWMSPSTVTLQKRFIDYTGKSDITSEYPLGACSSSARWKLSKVLWWYISRLLSLIAGKFAPLEPTRSKPTHSETSSHLPVSQVSLSLLSFWSSSSYFSESASLNSFPFTEKTQKVWRRLNIPLCVWWTPMPQGLQCPPGWSRCEKRPGWLRSCSSCWWAWRCAAWS